MVRHGLNSAGELEQAGQVCLLFHLVLPLTKELTPTKEAQAEETTGDFPCWFILCWLAFSHSSGLPAQGMVPPTVG